MTNVVDVDYVAKRIYLHLDTVTLGFDCIAAYFEINAIILANLTGEQNYQHMLAAEGNIPKGGGVFTPRYALSDTEWRYVPYDGVSHTLGLITEPVSVDGVSGRDVFDRSSLTLLVEIDELYEKIEIREVNTGGNFLESDRILLTSAEKHSKYNGSIYFDPAANTNGDGTRVNPFNVENDAIDFAESENISEIKVFNDWTPIRQIKNFQVSGVGAKQPTIDLNGQDMGGTRFYHVNLENEYVGRITAQECVLLPGVWLNGNFEKCGIKGDLVGVDGAEFLLKNCSSLLAGFGQRPSVDMLAGGTCQGIIHGYEGGLNILNCNQPTDSLSVGMLPASVTLTTSCIDGDIVVRGIGDLVNEGSVIITDKHLSVDTITLAVWLKILGTEVFP